jgi:hypothetical protein
MAWRWRRHAESHNQMTAAVQLAFAALAAEQAENQTDQIEELQHQVRQLAEQIGRMPKPEAIHYATLADYVMSRFEPRLVLLEERMRAIATDVSIMKMRARRAR